MTIDISDEGMTVTINGELRAGWVDLGEGRSGDYDPDDPDDVALLRLDVYVSEAAAERHQLSGEPTDDGWFAPRDTSCCTGVPVQTPTSELTELLSVMARELHATMSSGGSLKRACEALSWSSL
jgi:hypothetical protein